MFEETIKKHIVDRVESVPSGAEKLANEEEYKRILALGKTLYHERATHWLTYDRWTKEEAARLISGLLPSNDPKGPFFDQIYYLEPKKHFHVRWLLQIFLRNFECLIHVTELLRRSPFLRAESPKVWAEYASTKGLIPPDRHWADIDNSPLLSLLKAKDAFGAKRVAESTSLDAPPTYTTDWLNILNRAKHFYYPRRNPDPKRGEVVEWVLAEAAKAGLPESMNIAVAIFTIIKPNNHDPKKKRVKPS